MKRQNIIGKLEENPIIAAVRNEKDIEEAVLSPVSTIFLLQADIFNIKSMVNRIQDSNKSVMIHIDFLEGIGKDNRAMDYICEIIQPNGIISTRNNHIRYAMEKGMFAVQRFFIIDSMSYKNSINIAKSIKPDMIEILPGIIPDIIERISQKLSMPVIAGGLIETKASIIEILNSGALAVSTGKKSLWKL
jgi:glycerol uptake operon antiterminator